MRKTAYSYIRVPSAVEPLLRETDRLLNIKSQSMYGFTPRNTNGEIVQYALQCAIEALKRDGKSDGWLNDEGA